MKQKLLMILLVGSIAHAAHAQNLRLLTYNIRHAENEAGQINVKALADFILKQDPDVVALQEVDSVCGRSNKLDIAAELARPGGRLVYAVCSILSGEGAGQIEDFISRRSSWTVQETGIAGGRPVGGGRLLTPGHDGTDGFFVARLGSPC